MKEDSNINDTSWPGRKLNVKASFDDVTQSGSSEGTLFRTMGASKPCVYGMDEIKTRL
jgi:hypothetical protein